MTTSLGRSYLDDADVPNIVKIFCFSHNGSKTQITFYCDN